MNPSDVPVVILCGGEGTRFREETANRPKPLIEIAGEPILLHIMRLYAEYGFRRFILCLGYRGLMIKEFFLSHELRMRDIELDLGSGSRSFLGPAPAQDWHVIFAETGEKTQTGARIRAIQKYIEGPVFMATYGDGLSDIDLRRLLDYHLAHGAIGTVTGVAATSQFGELVVEHSIVRAFAEKPKVRSIINGGFFVFGRAFFDYLSDDPDCVLERAPMERLAADGQLHAFVHEGFWKCMDTFKDYQQFSELAQRDPPPWVRTTA
jgi:glucose-1-phosphate cytidylyltransferase